MKIIRSTKLPARLVTFESMDSYIAAAVDMRRLALSKLSGYPSPSSVVARVQAKFDFTSISGLLVSIKKLRDIAKLASEVMTSINTIKISRHTLNYAPILDFVTTNATQYGYKDMSNDDRLLVTYLIAASSLTDYTWSLILPREGENVITNIGKLYDECATVNGKLQSYNPLTDEITDIKELPYAKNSLERAKSLAKEMKKSGAGKEVDKLESKALALDVKMHTFSAIRLIDHLLMLFMDYKLWDTFLPARTADTPAENLERMEGLATFAGYLHSLLLMPVFYRTEAFRANYDQLETWLGDFPIVAPEIESNYKNIIEHYDTLSVKEDVGQFWNLLKEKSTINGAEVTGFLSEYSTLMGIDGIIDKAEKEAAVSGEVKLTEFKQLRESKFNNVLLSLSVDRCDFRTDITSKILATEMYKVFMKESTFSVLPSISRFLPEKVRANVVACGFSLPFAFSPKLPLVPDPTAVSAGTISANAVNHKFGTLPHTYEMEYILKEKLAFTINSARTLLTNYTGKGFLFDEGLAAHMREAMQAPWRSLYPGNVKFGLRTYSRSQFADGQELTLRDLLETITGTHIEHLRRSLTSAHTRERLATYISSFALLFMSTDGSKLKDSKGAKDLLVLAPGLGLPYGVSYEELSNLQSYEDKDMIHIVDGLYIAFLKKVFTPSTKMTYGTFFMSEPYLTFIGQNVVDASDNLVWSDGLLHMGLKPVTATRKFCPALFDRLFAYVNDSLLLQDNIEYMLPTITDAEWNFSLNNVESKWPYDVFFPFIKYIHFGSYMKGRQDRGEGASEVSALTKAVEQMEKDIVKTVHDSPDSAQTSNPKLIPDNTGLTDQKSRLDTMSSDTDEKKKKKTGKKEESKDEFPES